MNEAALRRLIERAALFAQTVAAVRAELVKVGLSDADALREARTAALFAAFGEIAPMKELWE